MFRRCLRALRAIAFGLFSLLSARGAANRTQELAALNQQLAASGTEIAAREREVYQQRDFLDTVLDSIAPDVLFVTDAQARLVRYNAAFAALFGGERDALVGHSVGCIFPSEREFLEHTRQLIADLRTRGHAFFEHTLRTRDQHAVRLEANVVWQPGMRVCVVVARDVTARTAMETHLRTTLEDSERIRIELATVFNTVRDALLVYGLDGTPLYANQFATQLFAGAQDAHHNIFDSARAGRITSLDGKDFPIGLFPVVQVLRGETAEAIATMRIHRPGTAALILATQAVLLRDARGQMIGALAVLRDVTAEWHSRRDIEVLRAIAQACASAAAETAVAEASLNELIVGMGFSDGGIFLRDSDRPGYVRIASVHLGGALSHAAQARMLHAMIETPIASDAPLTVLRVIATGAAVFAQPPAPRHTTAKLGSAYQHATIVPLQCEGEIFGALALTTQADELAAWEQPDHAFIRTAADQIATALHRARLYEEARHLALFDALTGLRNHRALQGILLQELAAGAAQSLPVSVIMLDIDHFRRFNEMYGHDVGDRALRGVAGAIQSALRGGDYAARYGGEEFVIVLPATDAQQANEIAVLTLAAIARTVITLNAGGGVANLSASLGHATFPLHASAPASLLKAADLALYAAKRSGRGCVAAYTPTLLASSTHLLPGGASLAAPEAGEIALPSGADLEMVQALITAIDLRDGYTAAHSDGVARFAVAIAQALALPAEHIEALRLGGLIHDVGKIGVPDDILRKPGTLDTAEWTTMRAHTTMGEEILRPVEKLRHLLPLVRWHHERLDGSGYPDGLKGEQIPLMVRILSVADVFEAFTAERPYHPGRPASAGLRLLQEEVALHRLDPQVLAVFAQILVNQGLVSDTARGEQDLQDAA